MYTIGVDLGGTNIKAALVNENNEITAQLSRPTALPRSAEAVCDDIAALCNELAAQCPEKPAGIGVGCPGSVDDEEGIILYSNNLDWAMFPMRDYLQQRTNLPVRVINDANAAALGEVAEGCAKGAKDAIILTLGTGLGAGVVVNGKILVGYTGTGSEAGHIVIRDAEGQPYCSCGLRGDFESLASATALIRMTKAAMEQHPKSLMHALAAEGVENGQLAFRAADKGDETGSAVVKEYIHNLALGTASLINVFFPQVVGFSGGVANEGENLLAPLREEVAPMVFGHAYARKTTKIVNCTLGYRAGVIGAALLAKEAE